MSDISPINISTPRRAGRVSVDPSYAVDRNNEEVRGRGGARPNDRVEFSSVAQYLSQLQSEPTQSDDLVNRVRAQIESGTYLTDDKLSVAVDELLDDIDL